MTTTDMSTAGPVANGAIRRYSPPHAVGGDTIVEMIARGEVILWRLNRAVDRVRVAILAETMTSSEDPEFLGPCPIYVADVPEGPSFLLDGQHRAAALAAVPDPTRFVVFLARIAADGEDSLVKEFERINCGTPVPPEYWDGKVRGVVTAFLASLAQARPGVVSMSERPQRPRYNHQMAIAQLCDHAGLRDAIRFRALGAAELLSAALELDAFAEKLHQRDSPAGPKCLAAAHSLNFHLGLDKAWTYQVATAAITPPTPL